MNKIIIKDTKTKRDFLDSFKKKKKWVIFYNWDNCGYCHRIRPLWDDFVSNNKNINFAEIERSQFNKMKLFLKKRNEIIPHFPYFVEYSNKKNTTTKRIIDNLDNYIDELNRKKKSKKKIKVKKTKKKVI